MQPVDLTTLRAVQSDLAQHWLPARIETIQQVDLWTLYFCLRTLKARVWLVASWHPQAARLHLATAPAKAPDPFQFSQSLYRHLKGLALDRISFIDPWERVLDWQFAPRPGDPPRWHFYLEIMGRYSNAVMVDHHGMIFACGHGVSERQSSVRPVQPGLPYQKPPGLTDPCPNPAESLDQWQERIALLPGRLSQRILKTYRGISRTLSESLLQQAGIPLEIEIGSVTSEQWNALYQSWQIWLQNLEKGSFQSGWTETGYTVLGWGIQTEADSIHSLLEQYYQDQLNRETFQRERHRLLQKVKSLLQKLYQRRDQFEQKLQQSDQAEEAKASADLLMAHLHHWTPGLRQIQLPDFETGDLITISLDPEKNAITNAQAYYKKHRKQKRAKDAVLPLWKSVQEEIQYLENVEASLQQLERYQQPDDLQTLEEIQAELIQQRYLSDPDQPILDAAVTEAPYRRYSTPSGFEVWIGRNNHQNDQLTFRLAQDQDWWFHTQEIPGGHVLLKLPPGSVAEAEDLQAAADLAAYFSKARLSDHVPVVYTRPKHVFKPKGALPGMVIYRHEKVIWAQPTRSDLLTLAQEPDR